MPTLAERWLGKTAVSNTIPKKRQLPFIGSSRMAATAVFVIVLFILGAIFAPQLAPYPEQGAGAPNIKAKFEPPSLEYWMGTDDVGRDIFSRILYGARISLSMGMLVVAIGVTIGLPLGALAGYYGGWVDEGIMRITDMFLAFPPLLLAIAISVSMGRSYLTTLFAITITWWPWYTRMARPLALSLRERTYIDAARCMGIGNWTIIRRHVIPNIFSPVLSEATIDVGLAILTVAGLSFIGLGVPPPTADWGEMVSAGRVYIFEQWWFATFPGLAILIVALAFNLLGDAVYEHTSPYKVGDE